MSFQEILNTHLEFYESLLKRTHHNSTTWVIEVNRFMKNQRYWSPTIHQSRMLISFFQLLAATLKVNATYVKITMMRPSQPETSNLPGNYPGWRSTKGKIPSRNPKKPKRKLRESGGSYSLVWVTITGRPCTVNTNVPTKDATEWPPQTATDAWTNITAVKAASTSTGRSTEALAPRLTYPWKIQLNMSRITRPDPKRQDRVHTRQPYSRHLYIIR